MKHQHSYQLGLTLIEILISLSLGLLILMALLTLTNNSVKQQNLQINHQQMYSSLQQFEYFISTLLKQRQSVSVCAQATQVSSVQVLLGKGVDPNMLKTFDQTVRGGEYIGSDHFHPLPEDLPKVGKRLVHTVYDPAPNDKEISSKDWLLRSDYLQISQFKRLNLNNQQLKTQSHFVLASIDDPAEGLTTGLLYVTDCVKGVILRFQRDKNKYQLDADDLYLIRQLNLSKIKIYWLSTTTLSLHKGTHGKTNATNLMIFQENSVNRRIRLSGFEWLQLYYFVPTQGWLNAQQVEKQSKWREVTTLLIEVVLKSETAIHPSHQMTLPPVMNILDIHPQILTIEKTKHFYLRHAFVFSLKH